MSKSKGRAKVESGTRVEACVAAESPSFGTCVSKYQDTAHGRGKRVHNVVGDAAKAGGTLRCTVCGRIRP